MKNFKVSISLFLLLAILITAGCSVPVSVQIGGTKNSAEQNRQTPPSDQPATASTPSQESIAAQQRAAEDLAQQQKQAEEQRLAEQQKRDEENKAIAESQAQQESDVVENQHSENQRSAREQYYVEQLRRAEEQLAFERSRRTEEQQLATTRNQREVEERRLAELQRQREVPVNAVAWPPPQPVYIQNQQSSSSRQIYPYKSEETDKSKKKGHSTRNKILAGAAIGGGAALGIWLSRRK